MAPAPPQELFGSRRRTEVLILVALLDQTYPSQLARRLKAHLYSVQTIVKSLEKEGVLATRLMGRIRLVTLDPGYYAFKELRRLLLRLAEAEPALRRAAGDQRQRTVRGGKSIT